MGNIDERSVAIIGMSGLYPEAADLEQLHANLRSGRDSVRKLSADRLRYSCLEPDLDYRPIAYLDRIDTFDHKFFGISKKEAECMEPAQRLLLELACAAIENAGYSLESLNGSKTGVFLGGRPYSGFHYYQLMDQQDPMAFTGTLPSMACGRISYLLNFTGPAMTIDVGCSSSLAAMHQACQALLTGDADYALVGGVSVKLAFVEESNVGHLGTFASDGRCKTFDALADGIGDGEGGGLLLLKRLDKALADNDHIHAVLKGSAVNHDGKRSNGLTTPSPAAQTEVLKAAWARAGVDPQTITYIEAHGTGTKLGDPVEFRGITDAFAAFTNRRNFCAVGSIKSNIGHLDNAAGITGVIKGVLSLKHRTLFPSLHFETPNPFIDFANSAAYVNSELEPWETGSDFPRRCGISSFGLSGTNAHLVLEEAPGKRINEEKAVPGLLKLSAKTATAWATLIDRLIDYLPTTQAPLSDILYTLNTGRSDYAYRLGLEAASKEELLAKLIELKAQIPNNLPEPIAQKERKAVLLFSEAETDEAALDALAQTFPLVCTILDEIRQHLGDFPLEGNVKVFAAQYALYQLWQSWGVPVKTLIGTGVGKLTMQVISGALSVADAVRKITQNEVSTAPIDEIKLKRAVIALMDAENPLFVEMGVRGGLSDQLQEWQAEMPALNVAYALGPDADNAIAPALVGLYNAGVGIDWKKYYAGGQYCRVEAPTYPFDKIRCWFKEPTASGNGTVEDWLYQLQWVPRAVGSAASPVQNRRFLVVADEEGLNESLTRLLQFHQNTCVQVRLGDTFRELSGSEYEIDTTSESDYVRLEEELRNQGIELQGIIMMSAYTAPQPTTAAMLEPALGRGVYAQFFLTKAFSGHLSRKGFQLVTVTAQTSPVLTDESSLMPVHAPLTAFLKGVNAEYPGLQVSSIDLSYGKETPDQLALAVFNEMSTDESIRFVAYRYGQRYVQQILPVDVRTPNVPPFTVKNDAVYLITGGASGIGLEVARSLAGQAACHLVILGRTLLPAPEEWEPYPFIQGDSVAEKVRALLALKALGAVVSYYAVDTADEEEMKRTFAALSAQYGRLDGVIHSAGIGNSSVAIRERQFRDVQYTLAPKVKGTVVLAEHALPLKPAFFIAFSSLNSIVPAKNSADYAAANAFEDAFAYYIRAKGLNYTAIHWPDWNETGLSFRKRASPLLDEEGVALKSINTEDGLKAFYYALSLQQPEIAVANVHLTAFRINPFFIVENQEVTSGRSALAALDTGKLKQINQEELTETEAKLMLIWYTVLKLDEISLKDDFFEIGGHSLNGRQVLNRIEKEFGTSLEFDDLFQYNTVKALAVKIDTLLHQGSTQGYEAIRPLGKQDYYDVSHAQKRFWILNSFGKVKEAYNVPGGYYFTGSVDVPALEKAFHTLIERHESLRTTFISVAGEPKQVIRPADATGFRLQYVDLRQENDLDRLVESMTLEEASRPFDLQTGPLCRARLLQLGDERFVFLITLHHILTDARSMNVLRNEIAQLYQAYSQGQPNPLSPLRVQYKDYVAWINEQLKGNVFQAHKAYWLKRLAGSLSVPDLPVDFRLPKEQTFQADRYRILLEPDTSEQLKSLSDAHGSTLFTTLLTLFKVLLYKYSGQTDLLIGTPISGRNHHDLEEQIGIYLNTIVLRTQIDPEESFGSLLGRVKENTFRDYEHQVYPFDLLVEDLEMSRADTSVFNTAFTWTLPEKATESIDLGFEIEDYYTGFNKAKADVWLHGTMVNNQIALGFVYKTDLFKSETIQLLAERFKVVIRQSLENPQLAIKDFALRLSLESQAAEPIVDIAFDFS